ncbi:MAG TPA: hypothetical protein IAA57_04650 [Candidatus Pullilachnospira intestinigallinarum]|nr:hypothetical protein [Candidatus Pullilachnospira intestinigallinarum]
MTSKISYSKMVKYSMGQRAWYGALLALAFFLCFPLTAMLEFYRNADTMAAMQVTDVQNILQEMRNGLRAFLAGGNPLTALTVAGGALLAAWTGLSYLHSSRKLDMVHSLPVKKEKIFLAETTASVLLFVIPYAVNLVLANLVGIFQGIYSPDLPLVSLAAMAVHLIVFLAVYFFAAVAMLLTGKLLTGILGSVVLLVYLPGLVQLLLALPGIFYETYSGTSGGTTAVAAVFRYLSPAYGLAALCRRIGISGLDANFWGYAMKNQWWEPLLCTVAAGAAMGMLALWLAKIRPSEGAGRSLVFPRTEGIIKLALLPVLGLAGGLFFRTLGDASGAGARDGWFWFGVVFTVAVCSIVIEMIYHFDRKHLLDHKLCTGIAVLVTAAVGVWFQMDLGGYDTFLPQESRIASMAVCYSSWYGLMDENGEAENMSDWLDENGQLEDFSPIYQLARQGVDIAKNGASEGEYDFATVIYRLKNGQEKRRYYRLPVSGMQDAEEALYQEEAYRTAIWPALNMDAADIGIEMVRDPGTTVNLRQMSQEERMQLVRTYQKELASMTYEQMQEPPVALISLCSLPGWAPIGSDMPINSNFTETLALLKDRGFVPDPEMKDIRITRITVEYYPDYSETDAWQTDSTATETVLLAETPEDIEAVRQNLVWDQNYWLMASRDKFEENIFVYVEGVNEQGESVSASFRYPVGKLPEMVKEFFGI